jgi:hypothetical protein
MDQSTEYLVDLIVDVDTDDETADRAQATLVVPGTSHTPSQANGGRLIVTTVLEATDEASAITTVLAATSEQLSRMAIAVRKVRAASNSMDVLLAGHDGGPDSALSDLDLGQLIVSHLDAARHHEPALLIDLLQARHRRSA